MKLRGALLRLYMAHTSEFSLLSRPCTQNGSFENECYVATLRFLPNIETNLLMTNEGYQKYMYNRSSGSEKSQRKRMCDLKANMGDLFGPCSS